MIHIATIHHNSDRWIDIQLYFIAHNISSPHKIYAFLSGVAIKHKSKFDYCAEKPIENHADRLNYLADVIVKSANNEDYILFIDGDAFPIKIIEVALNRINSSTPLVAIQRTENLYDVQPHPSFCLVKVKFWKEINGDWRSGYKWDTPFGKVTDVGGNLLNKLNSERIKWIPLNRTHSLGSHPLLFGIYGNLVYHHGAGFRNAHTRSDLLVKPKSIFARARYLLIPKWLPIKIMYKLHWLFRLYPLSLKENTEESNLIFHKIVEQKEKLFQEVTMDNYDK
ncbi:MAG: hypothetical protein PHD00_03485 [Bacteroidales bacterium]|jgi:hypothetical protein|nr:hypothetical protein [Bacteroidales bacterium]MDD4671382.1 hypothetical protein [Bacteroidales bacterium]MDY0347697.1 hypothetical protein [Tenuifilaceae bacterium]